MKWLDGIINWFVRRDPLVAAGERAAAEAERLWRLDVYDPRVSDNTEHAKRCKGIITGIITRNGWAGELPDRKYPGNGSPQWCGMFAGDCWREAGLDPKWLASFWASTLRLAYWIRYKPWNGKSAGTPIAYEYRGRMALAVRRDMKPEDIVMPDGSLPRAGDIVIVGDGTPAEGDHVTVLVAFDAETGVFKTISGNGGGVGPTGKSREGISKRDYTASASGYRVLWVMRPGVADLL